jgi:hypothetical protein
MLDGYDNVCTVKPVEQTDTLLLNAINSLRNEESECNCKCPPLSPRLWVACGGRLVCDILAQLRQTACARCLRVNSGHRPSAARRGQRQARPGCRDCHKRQVRVRSCRPGNAVPCPSKHEKRGHFTYRIVSALTLLPCLSVFQSAAPWRNFLPPLCTKTQNRAGPPRKYAGPPHKFVAASFRAAPARFWCRCT